MIGAWQRAFGQGAVAAFELDDDGVHEGLRRRRVGVLDDHDERGGVARNAAPLQRRRQARAVGGVALRDRRVVGEGEARDGERGHAGAQVDRLERGLVEAGALAAQRVADGIRKFFEHSLLRTSNDYGSIRRARVPMLPLDKKGRQRRPALPLGGRAAQREGAILDRDPRSERDV